MTVVPHTAGSGGTLLVDSCQICQSRELDSILFLGYLPPVNQMRTIGQRPDTQPAYPAEWLMCKRCHLIQLGLIVDPAILFPPEYPYTSGTTRILRENFAELAEESSRLLGLAPGSLIVDVGSNDGTLLDAFRTKGMSVQGIEPADVGNIANERGIPTIIGFFGPENAKRVRSERGPAVVVTATNVFAHIEHVDDVVENIVSMLAPDGVFISESHYVVSLVETLQYDTIYHEHLRYYSLESIRYLLEKHGLDIIHAKRIPTHGGSIRVYAARKGARPVLATVEEAFAAERDAGIDSERLQRFRRDVVISKLQLHALLANAKKEEQRIYGIGAPSRASTLIHYVGLDDGILDCVLEVPGSRKTGKYMPGTLIPVIDEKRLFDDQPDYALLLSWHIADELIPKLKEKGFRGRFIVPLPAPKVV
jgi:C-methyltransferase C-terminal domain/Methyltransferase domain/Putative zinc binding domain